MSTHQTGQEELRTTIQAFALKILPRFEGLGLCLEFREV